MNEKQFATICFLVLMQSGQGLHDKHITYIDEKIAMLNSGYDAFGKLDVYNQKTVIDYFEHWKIELPEKIKDCYKREVEAGEELGLI